MFYCRMSKYVKRGIEVVPIKFAPDLPLFLKQVTDALLTPYI